MNRKRFIIHTIQTGSLLILAGFLLFLCPLSDDFIFLHSPLLMYKVQGEGGEMGLFQKSVMFQVPLYAYARQETGAQIIYQNTLSEEEILLLEARDEDREENHDELNEQNEWARQQALMDAMEKENGENRQENDAQSTAPETAKEEEGLELPMQPVLNLNLDAYQNFDKLLEDFYVVDSTTYIDADELNVGEMLNRDLTLTEGVEGPQILIYHTHSQEAYADSVPGDKSMTVVGAGEKLAEILTQKYGLQVMHHTGEYDVEGRDYAYANVTPALEQILEENPSIEVVIDLHRDGVADGTHLVTEINGKKMAQFMFFNGLSRLKNTGEISYLKNENRAGNLAFSFQLQVKCQQYYPGLARKIYLKGYRYNLQYKEKSMLVELGAQTNTVEEVYNALEPLAHVIAMVVKGE